MNANTKHFPTKHLFELQPALVRRLPQITAGYRDGKFVVHRSALEDAHSSTCDGTPLPNTGKWIDVDAMMNNDEVSPYTWRTFMRMVWDIAPAVMERQRQVQVAWDAWVPEECSFIDPKYVYSVRMLREESGRWLYLLDDILAVVKPELLAKSPKHAFRWLTSLGVDSHQEVDATIAQALDTRYPVPRTVAAVISALGPKARLCFLTRGHVDTVLSAYAA